MRRYLIGNMKKNRNKKPQKTWKDLSPIDRQEIQQYRRDLSKSANHMFYVTMITFTALITIVGKTPSLSCYWTCVLLILAFSILIVGGLLTLSKLYRQHEVTTLAREGKDFYEIAEELDKKSELIKICKFIFQSRWTVALSVIIGVGMILLTAFLISLVCSWIPIS